MAPNILDYHFLKELSTQCKLMNNRQVSGQLMRLKN